ncbi:MAG: hypothetical protein P9M14_11375 [Candidatus Alcyoniella australis]|nr:hypothetical protein [Candidatus Alcyoniella australis]
MRRFTELLMITALIACLALCACEEERDELDCPDQGEQALSVSIETPANGVRATIGDELAISVRATGPYDVVMIQWHCVALLNVHPMQLQYGLERLAVPLRDARIAGTLNVPFNPNFRYLDIYAMAEDARGNRAASVVRVWVDRYNP